jgi:predicted DCC family thiol-disulfide oxidoreductase YuxK
VSIAIRHDRREAGKGRPRYCEVLLEKDGHISLVPDGVFRWRSQVAKAEDLTRGGSRLAPKRATKVAAQCSSIGNVGSHCRRQTLWRRSPLLRLPSPGCFLFPCSSQSSLIQIVLAASTRRTACLFDGACVLCSRGCGFVSKRDRRGYFRFVPMQLAEGRPLAEQLGINPDRPDSFALVANGQAYVKSEAVLRIARELPRWQWTWLFHFVSRAIRDGIYDLVARNRYRWFGRRDACILPNSDRSWPS